MVEQSHRSFPFASLIEAGWRTEAVDLAARKVTFQRIGSSPHGNVPRTKPDPWGCMAGTVTFMPGFDLTEPSGEVWNAEQGKLLNE